MENAHTVKGEIQESERRRAPRGPADRARIQLRIWPLEESSDLATAEGRLIDVSERGFRVESLSWSRPLKPEVGAAFAFEVRQGALAKVSGIAYVAWSGPDALGARLEQLSQNSSWEVWAQASRKAEASPASQ